MNKSFTFQLQAIFSGGAEGGAPRGRGAGARRERGRPAWTLVVLVVRVRLRAARGAGGP